MLKSLSGGCVLLDIGIHHFDLLRWLSGSEVLTVSAQTATLGEGIPVDDNAFVNLTFANGQIAQMFLSFATNSQQAFICKGLKSMERMVLYSPVPLQTNVRPFACSASA
ncbi:MAG: Gfo/Idh/MocA family protein [Chloroflexota bacterium]